MLHRSDRLFLSVAFFLAALFVPSAVFAQDAVSVPASGTASWIGTLSGLIWMAIRIVKDPATPLNVPSRYRPLLALGLGVAAGILDAVARGTPWRDALMSGVGAAVLSIAFQDVVMESVFGNRTEPKKDEAPPPPDDPDDGDTPTDPGAASPPPASPSGTSLIPRVALVCLALGGLTSCAAAEQLVKVAEAGRDVAVVAEPCLVEQRDAALGKCTDKECTDAVHAAFAPIADALDMLHKGWCMVSPSSEGCAK